jgi:transcriptional regulator with XRE-family HTH domain
VPRRSHSPARLGAVLRSLREARGLTQEQLSFKSGITTVMISRTENGLNDLRWANLERWLRALEVSWPQFAASLEH